TARIHRCRSGADHDPPRDHRNPPEVDPSSHAVLRRRAGHGDADRGDERRHDRDPGRAPVTQLDASQVPQRTKEPTMTRLSNIATREKSLRLYMLVFAAVLAMTLAGAIAWTIG